MKVEIDVGNRHVMLLVVFVSAIAIVGIANAYNSGGTGGVPATMGHSVDEIDWSKPVSQLCLGATCKTSWPGLSCRLISNTGSANTVVTVTCNSDEVITATACRDPVATGNYMMGNWGSQLTDIRTYKCGSDSGMYVSAICCKVA